MVPGCGAGLVRAQDKVEFDEITGLKVVRVAREHAVDVAGTMLLAGATMT